MSDLSPLSTIDDAIDHARGLVERSSSTITIPDSVQSFTSTDVLDMPTFDVDSSEAWGDLADDANAIARKGLDGWHALARFAAEMRDGLA